MLCCGTNPGKPPVTPNFTKVEMSSGTETLETADGGCSFANPQPRCWFTGGKKGQGVYSGYNPPLALLALLSMHSICSGIAQYPHSHMDAQPSSFSISKIWLVWPRQLPKVNEAGAGKPSMGTGCQSGVPGPSATGTTGRFEVMGYMNFRRGKSVVHNPVWLGTLCLWVHRNRGTATVAQTKGLTN